MTPTSPTPAAAEDSAIAAAADRLTAATRSSVPCAPIRDLLGASDLAGAYAAQRRQTTARLAAGATITGRKIGLTSHAVQQQLGVDRPDFGVLFDDMDVSESAVVPAGRLLQPKVEAEVAFVLGADLDRADLDVPTVRQAVDHAVAALEIVDSRVADWDIRITDTIADNASSGLYVLGERRASLAEFDPAEVSMRLYAGEESVSEGNGAACLGDPLHALLWLAQTARDFGEPLRAGQVVLSGALGPMVAAAPGATMRADITALGSVDVVFEHKER